MAKLRAAVAQLVAGSGVNAAHVTAAAATKGDKPITGDAMRQLWWRCG